MPDKNKVRGLTYYMSQVKPSFRSILNVQLLRWTPTATRKKNVMEENPFNYLKALDTKKKIR